MRRTGWLLSTIACCALGLLPSVASFAQQRPAPKYTGKPGEPVVPFAVVKKGGALDDGALPESMQDYFKVVGDRPTVLIFASKADDKLGKLVDRLQELMAEHKESKLSGFVTLIAKDQTAVDTLAKEFLIDFKSLQVPICVPVMGDEGIRNYGLSVKVDVSIITICYGKVRTNFSGPLTERTSTTLDAAVERLLAATAAEDERAKTRSGPFVGDKPGALRVTKAAGAEADGVSAGQADDYRSKYNGSPFVEVFLRKTDEPILAVLRELDEAVKKGVDKKLHAYVCLVGDNADKLIEQSQDLQERAQVKRLPICFVVDNEVPPHYRLNPAIDVTAIVNTWEQIVASNHIAAVADVDEAWAKSVVNSLNKQPVQPPPKPITPRRR